MKADDAWMAPRPGLGGETAPCGSRCCCKGSQTEPLQKSCREDATLWVRRFYNVRVPWNPRGPRALIWYIPPNREVSSGAWSLKCKTVSLVLTWNCPQMSWQTHKASYTFLPPQNTLVLSDFFPKGESKLNFGDQNRNTDKKKWDYNIFWMRNWAGSQGSRINGGGEGWWTTEGPVSRESELWSILLPPSLLCPVSPKVPQSAPKSKSLHEPPG